MVSKGYAPSTAAQKACSKFGVTLSCSAVKNLKHVQCHGMGPVHKPGCSFKLDEVAEAQLVEIVLLMCKARLPT